MSHDQLAKEKTHRRVDGAFWHAVGVVALTATLALSACSQSHNSAPATPVPNRAIHVVVTCGKLSVVGLYYHGFPPADEGKVVGGYAFWQPRPDDRTTADAVVTVPENVHELKLDPGCGGDNKVWGDNFQGRDITVPDGYSVSIACPGGSEGTPDYVEENGTRVYLDACVTIVLPPAGSGTPAPSPEATAMQAYFRELQLQAV